MKVNGESSPRIEGGGDGNDTGLTVPLDTVSPAQPTRAALNGNNAKRENESKDPKGFTNP
ncbi:MAG: hypothetical protein H6633_26475 [Anaerolineales bacterium]|nr:hypothetical protein [Anaerolineales bacterium]